MVNSENSSCYSKSSASRIILAAWSDSLNSSWKLDQSMFRVPVTHWRWFALCRFQSSWGASFEITHRFRICVNCILHKFGIDVRIHSWLRHNNKSILFCENTILGEMNRLMPVFRYGNGSRSLIWIPQIQKDRVATYQECHISFEWLFLFYRISKSILWAWWRVKPFRLKWSMQALSNGTT